MGHMTHIDEKNGETKVHCGIINGNSVVLSITNTNSRQFQNDDIRIVYVLVLN